MVSIIKRLLTFGFILGILVLMGFLYNSKSTISLTPEHRYEQIFDQKISKLFDIILGPNQYYVNSTVFLRHKEERSLKYVRTPKSILYEKETQQNSSESNRTESPELSIKKTDETLPGMTDIISSTRKYEVSQTINEKELSLQETNNSHKEIIEEIYYDEDKFEVIKPKHGLERIHILIMVNVETLNEKGLTPDILRERVQQIIPLKDTRGDQLIIEAKMIDFTPPYLKLLAAYFSEASMQRNLKIAGLLVGLGIIFYALLKLVLLIIKFRSNQKTAPKNDPPVNMLNEPKEDETIIPLNKKVIKTIEGEPRQTQEIVEYWMEQHYAKK